jgi:hypothetical protein
VAGDEGDGHLDEGDPSLIGECAEGWTFHQRGVGWVCPTHSLSR